MQDDRRHTTRPSPVDAVTLFLIPYLNRFSGL